MVETNSAALSFPECKEHILWVSGFLRNNKIMMITYQYSHRQSLPFTEDLVCATCTNLLT